ncbi:MAG: hypothetical protein LUO93_03390 [Methanomicrobiales archaeon]|nr:hypothetical protein [Methanomicrobiales archaeon]
MVNPDERIAELEGKVRELEALTRGLTDEMLDLKSIVMKLNTRAEERRVVVQPRPSATALAKKESAPAPAEAAEGASLEMIMQPDGTLKPERRTSSDYIIASGRYGQKNMRKGKEAEKEGAPLIYATEDDSKTDDSVVIKKKK